MGHAYVVGASEYGGPKDATSGTKGYKEDSLPGKPAYAELYMGHALGNLPYKCKLRITYRQSQETTPKSMVIEKLDIGAGGSPVSGHARRIDLWYQVAQQLGFSGTGLVVIERVDGQPISGPNDTNTAKYGQGNTTTGAGVLGTGIGPQTETEGHEASEEAKKAAENAAKAATAWADSLGKILGFLSHSDGWLRVGKVIIGGVLIIVAIDELTKISPGPNSNIKPRASGATKAVRGVANRSPLAVLDSAAGKPI